MVNCPWFPDHFLGVFPWHWGALLGSLRRLPKGNASEKCFTIKYASSTNPDGTLVGHWSGWTFHLLNWNFHLGRNLFLGELPTIKLHNQKLRNLEIPAQFEGWFVSFIVASIPIPSNQAWNHVNQISPHKTPQMMWNSFVQLGVTIFFQCTGLIPRTSPAGPQKAAVNALHAKSECLKAVSLQQPHQPPKTKQVVLRALRSCNCKGGSWYWNDFNKNMQKHTLKRPNSVSTSREHVTYCTGTIFTAGVD